MSEVTFEHHRTEWGGRIFADHPTEKSSMLEYTHGRDGKTTYSIQPQRHVQELTDELHRHHPAATDRNAAPAPEKKPEPEPTGPFFHGTTAPLRGYVRPAAQHGKHITFEHDTSREHAYATSKESDAWSYAEKAWSNSDKGHPRVYEVAPTGPHEKDPEQHPDGSMRGNYSGDRRSRHPWKVVREVPMPEHMGTPRDWNPKARKTSARTTWYHGTTTGHLPSIRQNGLDHPHLTTSPEDAADYAEAAAWTSGHDPVVLKVDRPNPKHHRYDQMAMLSPPSHREEPEVPPEHEQTWQRSARDVGAIHHDAVVPPEKISVHRHIEAKRRTADLYMHDEDTHKTNWDQVYANGGIGGHKRELHRGMALSLPDDLHAHVHDDSQPVHERAQALLDHIHQRSGKVGHFWTDAEGTGRRYAMGAVGDEDVQNRRYKSTPVVVHAHVPDREHIETDPKTLFGQHTMSYHMEGNQEIPLKHGAPVHIKGISWHAEKPDNEAGRPESMMKSLREGHDYYNDPSADDHHWTRHDFKNGIRSQARLAASDWASKERCPCCGTGDHPCGHECTACDGSGTKQAFDADGVGRCHLPHGADCRCPHGQARSRPWKRIFGPTHGLDHRLFDGEKLKPVLREDIMWRWHSFCDTFGLIDPDDWSIVYFSGSEASEWTSETLEGNNDFDVLVGVTLPGFLSQERNPERAETMGWDLTQEGIAKGLTEKLKATMVDPQYRLPGTLDTGDEFDQTWYVNPDSYHIADIKPYAAYDCTHDVWAVKPPHLPGWSMDDFPEGPGLETFCWGFENMTRAVLDMPDPYRHQEGYALWHFVHDERSGAFGPQGEGWYDPRNVLEKWLDQKGLMAQLWTLMHEATEDPHLLDSPADWSNTPVFAMMLKHSVLIA